MVFPEWKEIIADRYSNRGCIYLYAGHGASYLVHAIYDVTHEWLRVRELRGERSTNAGVAFSVRWA